MQVGLLFDFLIYSLLEGGCPNLKKKPWYHLNFTSWECLKEMKIDV
jgi:hypothetical protein